MSPVYLDNGLNDSLLHALHAIELLIEYAPCLHRVNCLKVISLPLDIHHDGKCSLRMASLLRWYLAWTRNCQISSGPQKYIVRQCTACTGHEICDALYTGELHAVALFLVIIEVRFILRHGAGKEPFHHILQESILCRQLCASAKRHLPHPVYCVSVRCIGSWKLYLYVIFAKPLKKADEAGINAQDICTGHPITILKFKGCTLYRICKHTERMMRPFLLLIVYHNNRFIGRCLGLRRMKCLICTLRMLVCYRCIAKIKYWHFYSSLFVIVFFIIPCQRLCPVPPRPRW